MHTSDTFILTSISISRSSTLRCAPIPLSVIVNVAIFLLLCAFNSIILKFILAT